VSLGRELIVFILIVIGILAGQGDAHAASWRSVRDRVMDLRERGHFQEAYTVATSHTPRSADELVDAEFIKGWIALRFLRSPEVAVRHFIRMAESTRKVSSSRRPRLQAQAGYWLGKSLIALGRNSDARTIFTAAAAYPDTFYGLLSASELKIGVTPQLLSGVAGRYPEKPLYWHDSRVRKELVLAIIKHESGFRAQVTSSKGAQGIMQVMPDTARHVGRSAGIDINLELMMKNPDYNIAVGSRYLADQVSRYHGNSMLAAAAYNAGPQKVDEWLKRFGDPRSGAVDPVDWVESIPYSETRDYVKKVIATYVTYMALAKK